MTGKRWLFRIAIGVLTLVVAIVASLGGLFAFLQTQTGLDFLAERIERVASDTDTKIGITRLEGSVASSFRIQKIAVSDRDGIYATLDNTRIAWRPLALFRGVFDIKSLSVERLAMDRLPVTDRDAKPTSLEGLLPGISLRAGKVSIDEILLATPVLGQAQRMSVTASGQLDADLSGVALKLSFRPMEGDGDKAEMNLDYAAHPARFAAHMRIEERAGGVISRLTGLPPGKRLFVDLSGDGPPDAWKGVLKLEMDAATADATVAIALRDGAVFASVEGTADIDDLAPPQLRPYFATRGQFHAETEFLPGDHLTIRTLSVQTDAQKLSGSGRYGIADRQILAKASVVSSGSISFPNEATMLSVEQVGIDASLEGSVDAPRVDLSFRMNGIDQGKMRLASLSGFVSLVPNLTKAFDINGMLKAEGVDAGELIPAKLLGSAIEFTVAGQLHRDATVQDAVLNITSGPATIEITGQFDLAAQSIGQFSIRHEKIEPVTRAAGVALDGTLEAEGTFRADAPERSASVTTSGKLAGFSGGSPELRIGLGKSLSFAGTGNWHDGAPVEIVGLEVKAAMGHARANGLFDFATGALDADISVEIPKLQRLSALAGTALAGRATVSAAIEGPISAMTVRGQGLLEGLDAGSFAIGNIGVGYLAQVENGALTAALRLGGDVRSKRLTGSADARIGKDQIALSAIDLTLGKNRLSGTLGFATDGTQVSVALETLLDDIGDIPGAAEFGLTGSGLVRLTGSSRNKDEITLIADFKKMNFGTGDQVSLDTATARIELQTPLTQPKVSGEVGIGGLSVAGIKRGQAKLNISGSFSKLNWSATTATGAPYPATLTTNGSVEYADNTARLSFEELNGEIAEQPFSLRAPFAISAEANNWRVDPVDISFASGQFRFSGAQTGGTIEADGQIESLPVGLLSLIDPRLQINGAINGTARVSGKTRQPTISVSLDARDVRPKDIGKDEFAGFSATLKAYQDDKGANVTLKFSGPVDTAAIMTLGTHPLLSFDPPSITLNSSLPLSGTFEAAGRLDLVDQLVGLGEDRISGRLTANAKLSGTLGTPAVFGEARLSGGSYEGAATGSLLRNVEGHATFTGDKVELVSLTADDGATGRLSGKGMVQISDSANTSGSVDVSLNRFAVLRHPLAEISTTGTLALSGSLQSPRLDGELRVDQAEIRIPDTLPENIVSLDVIEINGAAVGIDSPANATEPSAAAAFPVALDVAIEFPGQTFVRGRGLDSEWKGKMKVQGTSRAPAIAGKLEAVRGTFAFAGRTFVIKQGSVFLPDAAAEPEIEAIAEAQLSDIVARVEISGSISKPSISVSSEPSLPQEDVLAHILFGRTSGQLSAIQAAQLAQTAATLSGKGGAGIVDKVRQALGVDVLNVESQDGDSQGASLKAGKYLSEDVFLSVTQGTQPGSQKVGVEIQVFPNVTVESNVSGDADSNIGLNWKWDY